jgi:ribosome biogenesis GTPase A
MANRVARAIKQYKKAISDKKKFPEVMKGVLEESDIVLEVLDARFIRESRNKFIEHGLKAQGKRIIYVANKSDLIKKKKNNLKNLVYVSCKERKGIGILREKIKFEAKKIKKLNREKEKIYIGIIGYPNAGKSSVINLLVGRSSAPYSKQAGFTKGKQKIKLTKDILLIDSPGVIPEKNYSTTDKNLVSKQVKLGAKTQEKIKDPEFFIHTIIRDYPGLLEEHYKIESKGDSEIFLEKLGRELNILKKGDKVDADKVARKVIKDWQEGVISLD